MQKVIFNKWFILSFLLLTGLSAFSIMAYRKAHAACSLPEESCGRPAAPDKGELLLDAVSRQFTSFAAIQ